jgi:hypothetical protein
MAVQKLSLDAQLQAGGAPAWKTGANNMGTGQSGIVAVSKSKLKLAVKSSGLSFGPFEAWPFERLVHRRSQDQVS